MNYRTASLIVVLVSVFLMALATLDPFASSRRERAMPKIYTVTMTDENGHTLYSFKTGVMTDGWRGELFDKLSELESDFEPICDTCKSLDHFTKNCPASSRTED